MLRIVSIFIVSFLLFSCNSAKKRQVPVLIINNENFYIEQIDSLAKEQIYRLRKETMEKLISEKILSIEAEKRYISVDSLLKSLFESTENHQSNISKDSVTFLNYQYAVKRKIILDSFIYVLKNKYPVYSFLKPVDYNSEMIHELSSNIIGNESAEDEIIILFDFDCSACIDADSTIHSIYERNKERIKFKYIYYSDYIDKTIIACDAAAKQGKYLQMHDLILKNKQERNDSLMISFASNLSLNMKEFEKYYYDKSFIKNHAKNKEILNEMGIYTVPCFIVNGIFISDIQSFKYFVSNIIDTNNE